MAVVLSGIGTFLYFRLDGALNRTVNQGLRASADNAIALVREAEAGLGEGSAGPRPLVEADESFAQVIDARGAILDATPLVASQPLLSEQQLARAREETVLVDRVTLPGRDEPVRLLATPVEAQNQRLVVVVGASLEEREEALESLRNQLLIGGPIALLLASFAGYLLAGAALRPVESMRRRAAEISASTPGQRLPVPPARDEISRLGETLNEMLARLEAALARERRFVADASHELRTPLALLKAELELALTRKRKPAELEAAVRSAAEETDRLSQLAEDLLVLARADQGELPLRRSECDVDELLGRVANRFGRRAHEAAREVELGGDPGLSVTGDQLRLEQALGNLVENSLRHGRGRILLKAARNGERIELHVIDEGEGFPKIFLPKAFEPFSRADEARGSGGSGLGLAIVDVVARAHRGSAHAANLDGGGTDVWLSLPLEKTRS
jgi:two-component system OmpR family sensor kinase